MLGRFILNAASCKFRQEQSSGTDASGSLPLNDTSNLESSKVRYKLKSCLNLVSWLPYVEVFH